MTAVLAFATVAQVAPGSSANGDFSFGIDGAAGSIQFDAREQNKDEVRGQMVFGPPGGPDATYANGGRTSQTPTKVRSVPRLAHHA